MDAALREAKNYLPQIVQVAGQPIHRMTDDCVFLANIASEQFELRSVKIFARSLVHEALVERERLLAGAILFGRES